MADLYDGFLQALGAHMADPAADNLHALVLLPPCCTGSAQRGLGGCTCWEPVYDLDQTQPDPQAIALLDAGVEPVARKLMCGDCAYRPGSPERTGDDRYVGSAEHLEDLALAGRFWCHSGMRQPIAWRHPSGVQIPDRHDGNYDPPIVDSVPYKADGTPGDLCGGWDARRRALAASTKDET